MKLKDQPSTTTCPNCLTRDEALALRAVFDGMGGPVELDEQETAAFNAAADKIAAWCDGLDRQAEPRRRI